MARERGDLQKAKSLLQQALQVFRKQADHHELATAILIWGVLRLDWGDFRGAEASMVKALKLASSLRNAETLVELIEIMLVRVWRMHWLFSKAKAQNVSSRQIVVAYFKFVMACNAEDHGNVQQALEYAKQAKKTFVQFKAGQEIAADLQRIQDRANNAMTGAVGSAP